ncbi:MAG: hypothetical protein KY439_11935, partial [Actinobacteria bacterium]|nr:hypothetical protein [Actinomycetota bacterium]
NGAVAWMAQHPFDRHRSRARADVPQQLAPAGRERRQANGADVALGELAVVLEPSVAEAGRQGDGAGVRIGRDLDALDIETLEWAARIVERWEAGRSHGTSRRRTG